MKLNVECKKCSKIFDAQMGAVKFTSGQPSFELNPTCPKCGELEGIEDIYLTEMGQSQLTESYLESTP